MEIFHITSWEKIPRETGVQIRLRPGTQCAEGIGVYFSEGTPRLKSADGCVNKTPSAIIKIVTEKSQLCSWWKSKGNKAKFGKPRTWHTNSNKELVLRIESSNDTWNGIQVLECQLIPVRNDVKLFRI